MKDKITEAVIEDLKSRSERGIKKYNTTLDQNNKDNYMQHAYEEALDLAHGLLCLLAIIIQQPLDPMGCCIRGEVILLAN